jgi:acyl carrier protein
MADNTAPTTAAGSARVEDIEAEIIRLVAQTLYVEPDTIGPDSLFTELGLDSILVVEFCALLAEEMEVSISASTVYNLRTPRNVARHLVER